MKRLVFSMPTIVTIALVLFTESCKKGDEDPAISLKSRTARLARKWNAKEFTETLLDKKSGSQDVTQFKDGKLTGKPTNSRRCGQSYSESITFNKDGTYEFKASREGCKHQWDQSGNLNWVPDGQITIIEEKGRWAWVGKNKPKNADEKYWISNKEAILLYQTECVTGCGDPYKWIGDITNGIIWKLKKLSSDELKVSIYTSLDDMSASNDDWEYTLEGTYTAQ